MELTEPDDEGRVFPARFTSSLEYFVSIDDAGKSPDDASGSERSAALTRSQTHPAHFNEESIPRPINGLAVVWDLANFTDFYNQPDAPQHVAKYLNRIRDFVTTLLEGGTIDWNTTNQQKQKLFPVPLTLLQRKFLGDGELLIFELPLDKAIAAKHLANLFFRFLATNLRFSRITRQIDDEFQITNFPNKFRFAASPGFLYELPLMTGGNEYLGSCINLSSRLIKYSRNLSVVASATLDVNIPEGLQKLLSRRLAIDVRSFPRQKVLCLTEELNALSDAERTRLFES